MSKLYDALQDQLKTEHKKEAEDCIKIYNKLKEMSGGSLWSSDWNALVHTILIGTWPNVKSIFKPNAIGKIFLKGMLYESGEWGITLWILL